MHVASHGSGCKVQREIINRRWWQHYFVAWLRVTQQCASGRRCRGVRGRRPHPRALIAPICGTQRTHTRTAHAHSAPAVTNAAFAKCMYVTSVCKWKCTEKHEETTAVIIRERCTATQRWDHNVSGNCSCFIFLCRGDSIIFNYAIWFVALLYEGLESLKIDTSAELHRQHEFAKECRY